MERNVIAYDLGTGGVKASIYNGEGQELGFAFEAYDTYYPHNGWHEQKPEEWWNAVVRSTKKLMDESGVDAATIEALAISGHSLGVIPIGKDGALLREATPIWSDTRATAQAARFFEKVSHEKWYYDTGAGFPAHLYSVFKIMWYMDNEPDLYEKTEKFIGTKDYINYKMTGRLCTDYSYASGSGVYILEKAAYDETYINVSGIDGNKLQEIIQSTDIVGELREDVAKQLGLCPGVKVAAGGVDNACMALGAKGIREGRSYTSLGSSAWIAVSSSKPIVDYKIKSYVFAHIIPGMFASATSIFSAGTSHRWVLDQIVENRGEEKYRIFDELAEKSPIGAHRLVFNPSLAGGSGLDKSDFIRGGFVGIDLKHSKEDMARACLEGICINLRFALDALKSISPVEGEMLVVGGGTKSPLWMQIFADTYNMPMIETNVGQGAGSLGAAAIAAVAVGIWDNFDKIDDIHTVMQNKQPIPANVEQYESLLPLHRKVSDLLSELGDYMENM